VNEPEPVFEESVHGPEDEEADAEGGEDIKKQLAKTETSSSTDSTVDDIAKDE
jgi:hypothetical protein